MKHKSAMPSNIEQMNEIKRDMRALYDAVNQGDMPLKKADTLANIAGKTLKAEQLQLAREIFLNGLAPKIHVDLPQLVSNA